MKLKNKQLVSEGAIEGFWELLGRGIEEAKYGLKFDPMGNEKQRELLEVCGVWEWMNGGELREPKCGLIGYGGAAYGGKSYGMLGLASVVGLAYPGVQIAFFRRKYTEMSGPGSVMNDADTIFSEIAERRDEGKHHRFFNGSDFYFRHCEHDGDVKSYHGAQIDLLMIDEATSFSWEMVDYLLTRNRVSGKHGMKPFAVLCSNPGNIGHNWYMNVFQLGREVIRRWERRKEEGIRRIQNPNGKWMDVYFIPAYMEDNKEGMKRDPEYESRLMERDEGTAKALRFGDWEQFTGQVFKEFDIDKHVCKPFDIPWNWPKWRSVDWGYQEPFCCLWFTKDIKSGRIYVYREAYSVGLDDKQQSDTIALFSPAEEGVSMTLADPAMWTRKSRFGVVFTTADEYASYGVPLVPGDNDRVGGVRRIHGLLNDAPDGKPGMIFFDNCQNLIRTLPRLSASQVNPEDVGPRQEDHAFDALKYGTSNIHIFGEKKKKDREKVDAWDKVSKYL